MYLYLVQHAKARGAELDFERTLTDTGIEEAIRLSGFLSLFAKPKIVRALHSGKVRARQTAEIFAERLGIDEIAIDTELAPNSDPEAWVERLASYEENLLLVGHLPFLDRLASHLLAGDSQRHAVRFRNSGCLCLERSEDGWRLCWMLIPELFG